jgi:hypothetical protein
MMNNIVCSCLVLVNINIVDDSGGGRGVGGAAGADQKIENRFQRRN